jgi:hypothetical protein
VVVGAGLVRYENFQATAHFQARIEVNLILKNKDDSQLQELIEYWKENMGRKSDNVAIEDICKYLCTYCGGHFFATAKFTEYAFTSNDCQAHNHQLMAFINHFCSPDFRQTPAYLMVKERCLNLDVETVSALESAYCGKASPAQITRLGRIGLFSVEKKDVVSSLLINEYLAAIQPTSSAIALSADAEPQHNLELLIVLGLTHMDSADFHCVKKPGSTPVENALSAAWSVMAKQNVSNVFLQSQSRAESGFVDYYCNGFINGAVEFLVNGHTFETHINRFHEKKYNYQNWALFNFSMGKGKVVLPKDEKLHDKVYTYVHASNALYRGTIVIKQPAVESRPAPHMVKYKPPYTLKLSKSFSVLSRSFSVMARFVR